MAEFVNVIWSGIWLGAAYGLIAAGLAASFRAARLINLTVGALFVFAALMAQWLTEKGAPVVIGDLGAVLFVMVLSLAQERLILRRIVGAPPKILLLGTLAVSVALSGVCAVWFGRGPVTGSGLATDHTLTVGIWHPEVNSLILVIVSALVILVGWLALERTATGRAITAVGADPGAAQMLGINVWRLRLIAMAFAGFAGGIGGVLFVPLGVLDFSQGLSITLFGFVAAAIAGYRNVGWAFSASLAFGVLTALGTAYVSSVSSQAVAFGVLAIVLLFAQNVSFLRAVS